MSQAELLLRVAKAKGWTNHVFYEHFGEAGLLDRDADGDSDLFNPLANDADAFALAAEEDLFANPTYWHHLAIARLSFNADKRAAARRAVVLAYLDKAEGK